MTTQYKCVIPKLGGGQLTLTLETGHSIVIVGANGSGKTRLGVYIESQIAPYPVQRIAAQKSLALADTIGLISLERADNFLRFGTPDGDVRHKPGSRWGNKPVTHLLSDFDALLQRLFAEHNRVASEHLQKRKVTPDIPVPTTQIEQLKNIWEALLPHRTLEILESSIRVYPQLVNKVGVYPGSEMSDGERAMFYFLGQCLVAPDDAAIIIDEPEGHIHRAILGPLWDVIEKARPDCSFIYVTHDLDFAVTRMAAAKYFVSAYNHAPLQWDIQELPEDTALPEHVIAEIVGSRKPVLFVEGERSSVDLTIYRSHYDGFTILPIGSCESVIRSVASYKASSALHRVGARGLVDADLRDLAEINDLKARDVYALPVAEVENLLLLPTIFVALAEALLCADPGAQLIKLKSEVMTEVTANLDLVSARYTTRQLDRRLKRVRVDAKDLATLQKTYQLEVGTINPTTMFDTFKMRLEGKIKTDDLSGVLELYDNKGLLSRAASLLGLKDQKQLLEKVSRVLGGDRGKRIREELKKVLPEIPS